MATPETATNDPGTPEGVFWNMTNHTPSPEAIETIEALRREFIITAHEVLGNCPASRERSLAITKLEEALMWTVASIARQ